jgi:hypothetical protein
MLSKRRKKVISKKDILKELSDLARKQLDRKRKFALVNNGLKKSGKVVNESSDIEIELTGKQVKELDNIFKEFGSDLNAVLQSNLDEKVQPEYTKMSPAELEEMGVAITIDSSILDGIDEVLELGKDAKDWYRDMNQKILEAFGDSDGTLFLILLAIFSPSMKLDQNLKAAARTFHGIKRDLSNPETKEKLEQIMEMEPSKVHSSAFPEIMTLKALENIRNPGSMKPNLLRVLRLYKSTGYSLDPKQAALEISKHMKPTGLVSKTSIISAEKLFSFTLNLLDPDFKFESGWIPVTMDVWMSVFFYPKMTTEERRKALAAKGGINYVYLAAKTQELASRYGMTPIQFQAAIWVGTLKKQEGEGYVSTFMQAIDKNLERLNVKIDELKNMENFLSKVIEIIGTAQYQKPVKKVNKQKIEP